MSGPRLVFLGLFLLVGSLVGAFQVPRDEVGAWAIFALVAVALILLGVRFIRQRRSE